MNAFKIVERNDDVSNKFEEIMNVAKLNELLRRRDPMEKRKSKLTCLLAIVGAVTLIAGIAYAVYRYMNPDYLDDFDDEFDDYEESTEGFDELFTNDEDQLESDEPISED